jgi:hypothetical protein
MAELLKITMDGDKVLTEGRLFDMLQVKHLLRNAVDDIADAIEDSAKTFAPEHTGALKLHPVDRDDTRIGVAEGRAPLFGGGFAIQGPTGFIPGVGTAAGELIARSTITVAEEPFYAKYVHDGTGIYGPTGKRITAHRPEGFMTFPDSSWPTRHTYRYRKEYKFKSVAGQKPQPYLNKAFLLINSTYVPIRIEFLRAQIAAET